MKEIFKSEGLHTDLQMTCDDHQDNLTNKLE